MTFPVTPPANAVTAPVPAPITKLPVGNVATPVPPLATGKVPVTSVAALTVAVVE